MNQQQEQEFDEKLKQYRDSARALRRERNTLTSVSTLPTEVLGEVFCWAVDRNENWMLGARSYSFLHVCHHWRTIASSTPELWRRWGSSTSAWKLQSSHYRAGPVDLHLRPSFAVTMDDDLRHRLRECAALGNIRSIDLKLDFTQRIEDLISPILDGASPPTGVAALSIRADCQDSDVSGFFTGPVPKLRYLTLTGCTVPWDALANHTTALTSLTLVDLGKNTATALSLLLSTLLSNPLLEHLSLDLLLIINDIEAPFQVSLHHLESLIVMGPWADVFQLLEGLGLPNRLHNLKITLKDHTSPEDLSDVVARYVGQRAQSWDGGLKVLVAVGLSSTFKASLGCADGCEDDDATWFLTITSSSSAWWVGLELGHAGLGIIAQIPQRMVVDLRTTLPVLHSGGPCTMMPNLTNLRLTEADLSTLPAGEESLPGLRSLLILNPIPRGEDWGSLISLLTGQKAAGRQISTLRLGSGLGSRRDGATDGIISGAVGSYGTLKEVRWSRLEDWLRMSVDLPELYTRRPWSDGADGT